jgi:hypothetical protein
MQVTGPFNLLLRPGLRKNFLDEWDQYDVEYSQFLKTDTTNLPEQAATIMSGPNRMYELGDGEPITYEDAVIGPKVMGVDKEFGLGFAVSRKLMEDDQYGKANASSKYLAHAGRMTSEYRSAAVLDDAFTGTTFKGIDGLSLCNTAHTVINSSITIANRPASDVGFSMTGVTACFDLFQVMKDEAGDPIKIWPDTIILGNNAGDVNRSMQIFQNGKLEPFTAENQDNPVAKRMPSPKIVLSHFKSSLKSYFLVDSRWNDAWYLTRRAMSFEDTHDFQTGAALFKATTRFLIWFVNWRGWVGVNPT